MGNRESLVRPQISFLSGTDEALVANFAAEVCIALKAYAVKQTPCLIKLAKPAQADEELVYSCC